MYILYINPMKFNVNICCWIKINFFFFNFNRQLAPNSVEVFALVGMFRFLCEVFVGKSMAK